MSPIDDSLTSRCKRQAETDQLPTSADVTDRSVAVRPFVACYCNVSIVVSSAVDGVDDVEPTAVAALCDELELSLW